MPPPKDEVKLRGRSERNAGQPRIEVSAKKRLLILRLSDRLGVK